MNRSIPAFVLLSLVVAALGVFASGSWRDLELGLGTSEPVWATEAAEQAEPLTIPTDLSPTPPTSAPELALANLDLDPPTDPVCMIDSDEICDPNATVSLAPPPADAILGQPTLAPPRPTPIYPVASRFDNPNPYVEVVEVEIDLSVDSTGW